MLPKNNVKSHDEEKSVSRRIVEDMLAAVGDSRTYKEVITDAKKRTYFTPESAAELIDWLERDPCPYVTGEHYRGGLVTSSKEEFIEWIKQNTRVSTDE